MTDDLLNTPWARTSRFLTAQLRAACHYRDTGQDHSELLRNVNALWLGKGHHVFFDGEGRLTCHSRANPDGIPVGCRYYFNRWIFIKPDGSREVIKDVSLEESK